MFFPGVNPVLQGLNSYYVKVEKLIEHFQGEIDTGVIYFRGPVTEGAVFFESEYFLESFFKKGDKIISGSEAFDLIVENCGRNNYEIYIYYLEPEEVYVWAEVLKGQCIEELPGIKSQKKLVSDVKAFCDSKETGYFMATAPGDTRIAFFVYGEFIGYFFNGQTFSSKEEADMEKSLKGIESLLSEPDSKLGIFKKAEALETKKEKEDSNKKSPDPDIVEIMGDFINIMEIFILNNRKIKSEFDPLFKKQCMAYLDEYEFLDPFAAEFVYENGKIDFTGEADNEDFVESIFRCMNSISLELDINKQLAAPYKKWYKENQSKIKGLNLLFPFK